MDLSYLSTLSLFSGVREEELVELLSCLEAYERTYQKGQTVLHAGERVCRIGLLLRGSCNVVVNFYWGSSNIFGRVETGSVFGENYAVVPGREADCDVVACEDCTVLYLSVAKLFDPCGRSCSYHRQIIRNLLRISAEKNLELSARMMHIASKSIRGRLLSYLSEQALLCGNAHFTVPFSRQQLADYLGVDRSALSSVLGKMQKEGLLTFHKNEFTLNLQKVPDLMK